MIMKLLITMGNIMKEATHEREKESNVIEKNENKMNEKIEKNKMKED